MQQQEDYTGSECPQCGKVLGPFSMSQISDDIQNRVSRPRHCDLCKTIWIEKYQIIGYTVVWGPTDGG